MFKNLTNFGFTRTPRQAFGFYLAYFLLFLILALVIGGLFGTFFTKGYTVEERYISGVKLGTVLAILCSLIISFGILIKKQRYEFMYILYAVLSGVLALIGGGLLGLIPAAYLTTLPNSKDGNKSGFRDIEATPTESKIKTNLEASHPESETKSETNSEPKA